MPARARPPSVTAWVSCCRRGSGGWRRSQSPRRRGGMSGASARRRRTVADRIARTGTHRGRVPSDRPAHRPGGNDHRAAVATIETMPRASGGTAPAVLLLHGEERFLVEEKARALIAGWKEELVSDFGYEPLDGGALTAARLQDAILQAPFLDPIHVVWARGVPATRAESMAPGLAQVPETTRLLMTINGRIAATNKLAKAVTATGGT